MRARAHLGWLSLWLASVLGLGASGCSSCSGASPTAPVEASIPAEPAVPAPADSGPPARHSTGLTLRPQPPLFRVQETVTGFRVDPADARRQRNPWDVQLTLIDSDPLASTETKPKRVGVHNAHYRVEVDEEAGSGGPLHTLTASRRCGSKHIVMTARRQAEAPSSPDWSPAWSLFAASGCEAQP